MDYSVRRWVPTLKPLTQKLSHLPHRCPHRTSKIASHVFSMLMYSPRKRCATYPCIGTTVRATLARGDKWSFLTLSTTFLDFREEYWMKFCVLCNRQSATPFYLNKPQEEKQTNRIPSHWNPRQNNWAFLSRNHYVIWFFDDRTAMTDVCFFHHKSSILTAIKITRNTVKTQLDSK